MTETLLLAAAGSGLGLGAAWLISLPLSGEHLLRMLVFEGMSFDARVFLFAIAAAVLTAFLCGALPAAPAGRFDLGDALRSAGEHDTGRGTSLRQLMAACQIALSLMLLVGGLLLTRTVRNLYATDTGLDVQHVATLTLDVGTPRYDGVDLGPVYRRILDAVQATPGVEAAALDCLVTVQADVAGRDLGGYAADVQAAIRDNVPLPSGVFVVYGGHFENQQRAMARLRVVVPIAIGVITLLLYGALKSWGLAALVLANLPFAAVGGVFALRLRGFHLGVSAAIGFFALFGVAVLNGLVLLTTVERRRFGRRIAH